MKNDYNFAPFDGKGGMIAKIWVRGAGSFWANGVFLKNHCLIFETQCAGKRTRERGYLLFMFSN